MDMPTFYASALAAGISYLILFFLEDLIGVYKKQRIFFAIVLGILYYHYGDNMIRFIKTIFSNIGL